MSDEMIRKVAGEVQHRTFRVEQSNVNEDLRTVDLAFSSELPYERFWGVEILDHSPESVRMDRLVDGAPVLVNHNTDDMVGVVEVASIDEDRRGRASVRFGESARAQEIFQDIATGIRRHISVGYEIHDMALEKKGEKGGLDTYRVTSWTPLEISTVPVPADPTVGIGRAFDSEQDPPVEQVEQTEEVQEMSNENKSAETPVVDVKAVENKVREAERARVREMAEIGKTYDCVELAAKMAAEGNDANELRQAILDARQDTKPINTVPEVGMSKKEVQRYSILRAAEASHARNWSKAGLEAEVNQAIEDINGKPARGFYVPYEALTRTAVSYAGSGDEIVATDHESGSFIDLLRNRSRVVEAGARVLTGLQGNVDIPALSSGATAYWLASETTAVTESLPVLATVSLTPNTVALQTAATRRMRIQSSPDIEALLQQDLRATAGTAIDYACLSGSGSSGQPQGIFSSYTGVGSVVAGDGTDGAAMTYADVVNLWREVAKDNAASGALGFMTNSSLVAKLMTTAKVGSSDSVTVMEEFDRLLGFPCYVTEQVASGVTVGSAASCSSIAFGNWNDMIIGVWGTGLDMKVDEITLGTTGGITFRVFQDVDMKVRHASSFAICEDAVDV